MKKLLLGTLLATAAFSAQVHAGSCGGGKIVDLKEGGWGGDGLGIALAQGNDPASAASNGNPTKKQDNNGTHFTYFSAVTLGADHLNAIRRLATLAFAMNATVWLSSSTDDCAIANELSLYR